MVLGNLCGLPEFLQQMILGARQKKKRQDALGPGMNKHFELKNGGTGWEDELLFQLL